jgi:hypothetical protein
VRSRRDFGLKRAMAWLFAATWLAALTLVLPRGSAALHEATRAPSASLAPARDAGQALVRSTPVVSVAAPAPDPTPRAVQPRRSTGAVRAPYRQLEASVPVTLGAGVRVVRWQRHVPLMDSGEPPRSDEASS